MKSVIAQLSIVAASAVIATSAYAGGGIGHAGSYHADVYQTASTSQADATSAAASATTEPAQALSRADVRAGIVDAYNDGSLPNLNRNTYPDRSLTGDVIAARHAKHIRDAAVAEQENRSIVAYANGSSTQANKAAAQ